MSNINNIVNDINYLKSQINNHVMCRKFEETKYNYTVYYPEGYFPNGCRVSSAGGKMAALKTLLQYMDKHYDENHFPNWRD